VSDAGATRKDRIFPLHLTPFETYMLWDDRPEYPSTVVSEWQFTGRVVRDRFERAMDFALERHPLLRATVRVAKLNRECWVLGEAPRPKIQWGRYDEPVDWPAGESIDLRRTPGLLAWMRADDERATLTFLFHHASCDGIGLSRFVGDLLWSYAEQSGDAVEPTPPLPPDALRKRLRATYRVEEFLDSRGRPLDRFRNSVGQVIRETTPVNPPRGENREPVPYPGILMAELNAQEYRELKAAALARGQMANDVLLERLFVTLFDWNDAFGQPGDGSLTVLVPLDLRETDSRDISAANLVTYAFIHRKRDQIRDRRRLIDGLRDEMAVAKQERHRSPFMGSIVSLNDPNEGTRAVLGGKFCVATAILSNAGDPTRRFLTELPRDRGLVRCGDLRLEGIQSVPPLRPFSRVTVFVGTYRRNLRVCLRCDPRWFTLDDTQAFLDRYMRSIRESTHVGIT